VKGKTVQLQEKKGEGGVGLKKTGKDLNQFEIHNKEEAEMIGGAGRISKERLK